MTTKTPMTDYEVEVASFVMVFLRKHRAYFEAHKMPEDELIATAVGHAQCVVAKRGKSKAGGYAAGQQIAQTPEELMALMAAFADKLAAPVVTAMTSVAARMDALEVKLLADDL